MTPDGVSLWVSGIWYLVSGVSCRVFGEVDLVTRDCSAPVADKRYEIPDSRYQIRVLREAGC